MSTIEALFTDTNPLISLTARQLAHYQEELENEEITKAEFIELSNDLLSLDVIDKAATNAEDKIIIKQAFDLMITIAGAVAGG